MTATTNGLRGGAAVLVAAVLLACAGCGDTDADPGGAPDDTSATQSNAQASDGVSLKIGQQSGTATLSATNESNAKLLVLLPVGEPEQTESANGVTLTYVRSSDTTAGEEPELYEAAELAAGSTSRLDLSTVGTWTSKVRICLETVPPEDVAAEVDSDTSRVHARAADVDPVTVCSPPARLDAT